MKKYVRLVSGLMLIVFLLAINVCASGLFSAGGSALTVSQNYESDAATDDFAYTCWSAMRPQTTTDGDNTVLDLTPKTQTEASIEGLDDMPQIELQFDVKALYASSELRVQLKLADCNPLVRIRPGTFVDTLYEKKRADFDVNSNIYKGMWMSSATVDTPDDLVSDEWFTVKIMVNRDAIGTASYAELYNAISIQYKKKTDDSFAVLPASASETPWNPSWAVMNSTSALCDVAACNVFINNPSDTGQQYGVWVFDEETDTITKLATSSHYYLDNVVLSGMKRDDASSGVLYTEKCDIQTISEPPAFKGKTNVTSTFRSDSDGNRYVELYQAYDAASSDTRQFGQTEFVSIDDFPENFIITIDVFQCEDNNRSFRVECHDKNGTKKALNLWPENIEKGKWYRLKIVKNGDVDGFTLHTEDFEAGTVKKTYEGNAGSPTNQTNKFLLRTDMASGPSDVAAKDRVYHWYVDNLTIAEIAAVELKSATREDNSVYVTAEIDVPTDDAVTNPPVYNTSKDVTAILALYKDGKMCTADYGERTVADSTVGGVEVKLCATADDFDEAVFFVWDSTNDMFPIVEKKLLFPSDYTEPFFQDFYDLEGWTLPEEGFATHYPEEGLVRLRASNEHLVRRIASRPLKSTVNYDVEFRTKLEELSEGENQGQYWFSLSDANGHTWLSTDENWVSYIGKDGESSIYMNVGYDWHTWRAEVRDGFVTWYLDGKKVVSYEMSDELSWNKIEIWLSNEYAQTVDMLIDWVKYTPYFDEEINLTAPQNGSEFSDKDTVTFSATPAASVEKVDYYVNEVYVGSGYKAEGYSYSIQGMKPGKYRVTAAIDNIQTMANEFTVKPDFSATLAVDKNRISYGESVVATVNASDGAKAEFFLNGQLYGTDETAPFEMTLSGMDVGNASITAKAYRADGVTSRTEAQNITVAYVEGEAFEIGGEYEINYALNSSEGSLDLRDGYFNLNLKHSGNTVTYLSTEGEETYEGLGTGDYRIVVTAGYGELYYNGHFAFSFRMPYAPDEDSLSNSGLSNLSVLGSGVKNEIYRAEMNGQTELTATDFVSGQFYSIEFDKNDTSAETLIFNDGIFENKLYFREDGLYAQTMFTNDKGLAEETKLTDEVKTGYYRITVAFGIATVTLDNKPIAYYRCYKSTNPVKLQRTVTNPDATTFVAIKNSDDVYYHSDNFEEVTEFSYADYWSIQPESYREGYKADLTAQRKASDGNHYMEIQGTGTYLLNAIDQRPMFKWRGMVEKRQGVVYTVIRRSVNDRYSKISYDFGTSQWKFEMFDMYGNVEVTAVQYDADAYSLGQWYDFELVTDGFEVVLLCDGTEKLRAELEYTEDDLYYGRMGFGATNGTYCFDDVEYEGSNRATAGFYYTNGGSYDQKVTNTAALFYDDEEGNIYASSFLNSLKSTDGGKTWGDLVLNTDSNASERVLEEQLVRTPDGNLVRVKFVYGANDCYVRANISEDNGKTWSKDYPITRYSGGLGAVNRLTCTMNGTVFISTTKGDEKDGIHYVFRSVDGGQTWEKSETVIGTYNTGVIINEVIVVDTPRENEVWLFTRGQTGFVEYFISYDNGKTFDLTPHHTGLIAPQTCFRVERDWNNPNTYYAIFVYDAEPQDERETQSPRNRAALAVSYDGMETWEYVTDILEANDNVTFNHTSDSGINIIGDKLLWRTSSMTNEAPEGSGPCWTNFGVQEIDKIKPLKRMPQVHERVFRGFDLYNNGAADHCVLPKADGKAWIYGQVYDVSVSNGRIDADTAEKVFGVTATQTSSKVTLTMGSGTVVFTEDSTSVSINGKATTTENIGLENGYIDLKTLCDIYGKVYCETEETYAVMDNSVLTDKFQNMLHGLAEND